MPQAILAVDPTSKVLLSNAAARRILERRDGLMLKGDRLAAAKASDSSRLAACLAEYSKLESQGRGEHKWLKIERRNGIPYALVIAPVRCVPVIGNKEEYTGSALVMVLDFEREMIIPPQALREVFSLTPAETRLCSVLLGGTGLDAAAENLHVSPHTVRTQIRSIFSKLHLTRQQQLIRLLATFTVFGRWTRAETEHQ